MLLNSKRPSALHLQVQGTILVALSGMLYGVMGYLGTQLFHENFSIPTMLFWRFFIASLWMLLTLAIAKKNIFQNNDDRATIMRTFILGTLSYCGASSFYFLASQHIGTGAAMVIFFSYPIFVALFTWVLSTWRMNKHALLSLFAVVIGLILLKGRGENALNLAGILFAMLASLSYAAYIYSNQHSAKTIDSRLLTLLVCLGNTILFLIISLKTNNFVLPASFHAWFYILSLGIIATALPIQLLLDGLKYISPIKASILSVLEPVVTILVGIILLNESLSYLQTFGVIIVLLGALLIQFERTQDQH